MVKRIVLSVAVLVVAALVYMYRQVLQQQADVSYRAARALVSGDEAETKTDAEATPSDDADKKSAQKKPAPKQGSLEGNGTKQNDDTSGVAPPDSVVADANPTNPNTDVMIVASGSSIGSIQPSDVFGDARVYTTYIKMNYGVSQISEWTMQYALLSSATPSPSPAQSQRTLRSVQMEPPVRAPIPIQKESPQFPTEIVAQNQGSVVVVYAVINAAGKMEQLRILQGSEPQLNNPILEALQKWSFQPAQVNGAPVAVKSLFGIVLPNAL
jgi:TonB family protein